MTFIGIRFKEPRFRKKVQCINVFLACFGILERGDSTVNLYIVSEWHNIRSYSIWDRAAESVEHGERRSKEGQKNSRKV